MTRRMSSGRARSRPEMSESCRVRVKRSHFYTKTFDVQLYSFQIHLHRRQKQLHRRHIHVYRREIQLFR